MNSKASQFNAIEQAIDDFYRNNPKKEVSDRNRTLGELLMPIAAGILGAHSIKALAPASAVAKRMSRPSGAGLGAGFLTGIPAALVGSGARRKEILRQKGIDTNMIGSYAQPTTPEGEKYFK
jgi:hypothetical protein